MELLYEMTMLGLGRMCANSPLVAELVGGVLYAQTVTIVEHSSHPSPPNTSARSGAESEQLSIAISLICQSDGAHDCTCVEPRALFELSLCEIALPI